MEFKSFFFNFLLSGCISAAQAQTGHGGISGTVMDVSIKPVAGATVSLTGSRHTKTVVADARGAFHFSYPGNGNYTLSVSCVGFKPYSDTHLLLTDSITLIQRPPVILRAAAGQALKGVTVTSRKPLVEHKIDRTVINVDEMLDAAGSNALDVLSRSPGVSVNENGNISFNGKGNVWVLIDDRPVYMSGQDLAAYLRALPAGTLDKLELISNPPARYDAAGNAIINIVLKKNKTAGFNGTLSPGYSQGAYARSNDAINFNYRRRKFNLFSNVGYSLDQNYSQETYRRYFYKTGDAPDAAILQSSRYTYQSNSFNGRAGMDYFASPATTLGVIFTANTRPRTDLLHYTIHQYDGNMQLDSVTQGATTGTYAWQNTGINLNFQQKLDTTGAVLTTNLDYLHYHSGSNKASPQDAYAPDGSLKSSQQRAFTLGSDIIIYAGKIDYTRPLKGKAEFSAGIKNSHTSTDATSDWFDEGVQDFSKSNHFGYTENISSAYVNLRKEWKRWGTQAGLRLEHTAAQGHQFSNPFDGDTSFTKYYTNLFPSLYLSYKLGSAGNNMLVLSYSKRIGRPNYRQVNPFLFFVDQYTYTAGNPDITAAFTQYVELRYSYKQYFGLTLSYGGGRNGIHSLTNTSGNIFLSKPYNAMNSTLYGLIPYVSCKPFPWWQLNLNAVLLYLVNQSDANGISINQHTNVHEIEITNHFQISKTWGAALNGFFPGRQSFGQTKAGGAIYNISLGVQKEILHGNGSIRFNMNDILHTMSAPIQTTNITRVAAFSYKETESRWAGISFTYRFGKQANARKRNDNGSAEEEKGRAN